MRVNPTIHIGGSKEIPNPERPSWWADFSRQSFTQIAVGELPRIKHSRFSLLSRASCTGDEPARPSSLSQYRQAKRARELWA